MNFFHMFKIYNMCTVNRKVYVQGLLEDLVIKRIVDIEDLNSSVSDKLKTRRKKMSLAQKQLCDEVELF